MSGDKFGRNGLASPDLDSDSSDSESKKSSVMNDDDDDNDDIPGNTSSQSGHQSNLYPNINDSCGEFGFDYGSSFQKYQDDSHCSFRGSELHRRNPSSEQDYTGGSLDFEDSFNSTDLEPRRQRSPRRKIDSYHSEETFDQNAGSSSFQYYCLRCVCILFVCILFYVMHVTYYSDESIAVTKTASKRAQDIEIFEHKFQELTSRFPNQTERHWKVAKVVLKKLLRVEHSTQPAIVLFASLPHANKVMSCVAQLLAKTFTEVTQAKSPVVIHGKDLAAQQGAAAKLMLDEQFSNAFQSGSRVAVLQEIDLLDSQPLLLLHSYCDHENANFKDAVLLFTLKIDAHITERDLGEEYIEDYLEKIWDGKLGVDEMGALRSRVANNKVISQAETDDIMKQHCGD